MGAALALSFRAFVSSTFDDLERHRARVITALRRAGFDVDPMEDWTAATDEPKHLSQDRVEGCDLCVLLVGLRRGHIPEGETRSITQLEYQAAVDLGIDVLVFMLDEDASWPPEFDEREADPGIGQWRAELREQRTVGVFGPDPATIGVDAALTRWVAARRGVGLGVDGGFRPQYQPTIGGMEAHHAVLLGRDHELAALTALAIEDGYVVVEGGAWSGKTAVMTHLARQLRADGMLVVQFFISERTADIPARFFEGVNPQLLDMLAEPGGLPPTPDQQAQQFAALWAAATRTAKEQGRRLVLLVDALDEQDLSQPITPHLPASCGENVAVVVTTRENPDYRTTIPSFHALANVPAVRVYPLGTSPHAAAEERDARRAISSYLESNDATRVDLVGLFAFARGPLSADELAQLLGTYPGAIDQLLAPLKRHLRADCDHDGHDGHDGIQFGHVELERQARRWFGQRGEHGYTDRLLAWADTYQDQGWPKDTPTFLIFTIDSVARHATWRTDHTARLVALTSDDRSHLLFQCLGHAQPLLETLDSAYTLVRAAAKEDLFQLFQLAVREHDAMVMSNAIPSTVIAALAATGRSQLAHSIAGSITDEHQQAWALARLAPHVAADDLDRGLDIARSITDPDAQADALAQIAPQVAADDLERGLDIARSITGNRQLAEALVQIALQAAADDLDRGLDIARSITDPYAQAQALARLAQQVAADDLERGLDIARSITDYRRQAKALVEIAQLAAADDLDQGLDIARSITDPLDQGLDIARSITDAHAQADALAQIAPQVAADNLERGLDIARSITGNRQQAEALVQIALQAAADDLERGLDIARSITDPYAQADALAQIAQQTNRASIADEALATAYSITGNRQQAEALARLAPHVAAIDLDRGLDIARSITDNRLQAWALARIARQTNRADIADEALASARRVADSRRAMVLGQIMRQANRADIARRAAADDLDRGLDIARSITHYGAQADALAQIAQQAAADDLDRGLDIARSITDYRRQAEALVEIAQLAAADDLDRGLNIARSITHSPQQAEALAQIAQRTKRADIADEALAIARRNTLPRGQAEALAQLAPHVAADALDRGLDIARSITHPYAQAEALAGIARQTNRADIVDEALAIAHSITDTARRGWVLADVALHVAANDLDRGLLIARSITFPLAQAEALAGIGRQTNRADIVDEALAIAHSITDKNRQAQALAGIARQTKRADTANSISSSDAQARGLARIAHQAQIIDNARRLTDGGWRAWALARIAVNWPDQATERRAETPLSWLADRWAPPRHPDAKRAPTLPSPASVR